MERESIHISIQSSQCSVAAVAAKIQEEIDSEEGYVILNTQGSEIKESSSTKGKLKVERQSHYRKSTLLNNSPHEVIFTGNYSSHLYNDVFSKKIHSLGGYFLLKFITLQVLFCHKLQTINKLLPS